MGCHFLFQGIFLTQGSNPCLLCLLNCRWVLYNLSSFFQPSEQIQNLQMNVIGYLWFLPRALSSPQKIVSSPSLETPKEMFDVLVLVGEGDQFQAGGWTQDKSPSSLADALFYNSASSRIIRLPSLAHSKHNLRLGVKQP